MQQFLSVSFAKGLFFFFSHFCYCHYHLSGFRLNIWVLVTAAVGQSVFSGVVHTYTLTRQQYAKIILSISNPCVQAVGRLKRTPNQEAAIEPQILHKSGSIEACVSTRWPVRSLEVMEKISSTTTWRWVISEYYTEYKENITLSSLGPNKTQENGIWWL